MSVLNTESKINAKVKRTSHFGTLEWNGLSNRDLLLNDIPETADIKIGDSIITGGMSLIFPEGINIGVISEIMKQEKFIEKKSIDSLKNVAFQYQNAKVISNNLSSFKNNLIINKGTKHGLKNEMGVISSTGIVGIIDRTS